MNNALMTRIISSTFIVFTMLSCTGKETPLKLNEGKITDNFHKKHLGEITFMEDYIAPEMYSEKNFINSVVLGEETNLNIRVYLEHTQTYYLQQLAPDLTVNELCDKGHYEFKFYIDNKLQYTDQINPGAWSCDFRNQLTAFRLPLVSIEKEDQWGRFMWVRFMKKGGGEKALENGDHTLRMEIRPYIDTGTLIVGNLLAQGEIDIIHEEVAYNEGSVPIQKIVKSSSFETDDNAIDTITIRALNKKIAQGRFKNITSIVVIQNNTLVMEEYFDNTDRTTLHDTRSVGKSFASALMGIAIDKGHIKSRTETLESFYDLKNYEHNNPLKTSISIEQLLSMCSALSADDQNMESPGQEEQMYPTDNWAAFALNLPLNNEFIQEENFHYNSASATLVGDILHHNVPEGLEAFAKAELFTPLAISNYQWQYTPRGQANTAGSLKLNTLDLAKFGQLYAAKGIWQGTQVIPASWIETSISNLINHENGGYGYFFWTKTLTVDNIEYEIATASGNGGNQIVIFKDYPLVIVITATAYGEAWAHFQTEEIITDYIVPALHSL